MVSLQRLKIIKSFTAKEFGDVIFHFKLVDWFLFNHILQDNMHSKVFSKNTYIIKFLFLDTGDLNSY